METIINKSTLRIGKILERRIYFIRKLLKIEEARIDLEGRKRQKGKKREKYSLAKRGSLVAGGAGAYHG